MKLSPGLADVIDFYAEDFYHCLSWGEKLDARCRFFDQTRAIPEFHLWHRELKCDGSDCEWIAEKDGAQILPNPLIPYFAKQGRSAALSL